MVNPCSNKSLSSKIFRQIFGLAIDEIGRDGSIYLDKGIEQTERYIQAGTSGRESLNWTPRPS